MVVPASASRPSLVVETVATIDEAAIDRLRQWMYGLGCPNGLLFDAERCLILRDTFEAMGPHSILVEDELPTASVLERVSPGPGSLEDRIDRWLAVLAANWDLAIPDEPGAAAPFLTDIVPAAAGSRIQQVA